MKMLSKKIVNESHGQDSSYFLGWEEYEKNPYHQAQNPKGIIQMGLAENQLSFDLLESWLSDHPEALGLKDNTNTESLFKDLALFQDYHGLPTFKNVLAEFMSQIRGHKVKFDPNKLVLTAGSTSANETLMFCLADPGDAFLIPTPYYPGFDRDLKWRTGVEIVPIHCSSSNGFRITSSALEQAYKSAESQGFRVRGVLVTNPSNPLGTTLDREEIDLLIDFASDRDVHLVSDEIYSGTAFDDTSFVSVAEALSDRNLIGSDVWARVHIVYSLSKDLGLPGFRVGMVYSNDADVVSAATKMSSFGLVSAQTQHTLSQVLSDRKFAGKYVRENRRRLRKRKDVLVSGLKSVGIKCLTGNACLFSWVDMRGLLTSDTFEAELELWKRIVYEVGINVSPGSSCHCSEPGWFRICFANMSEETLYVAIQRIRAFAESMRDEKLKQMRTGKLYSRTRSLPKWVFQLSSSFNDRRRENDR